MNVLLAGEIDAQELAQWRELLERRMPEARWCDRDEARHDPAAIEAAVVANPAPGSLTGLANLRLIQSLWAGVDRLLADATVPAGVPIARMVDPAMSAAMAETALWAVLGLHRRFFDYADQQREASWQQHEQRRADEVNVLVLGAGHMGRAVAHRLATQGYRVATWRASDATPLEPQLALAEIVISLVPLTPTTRGLFDARFFAALPRGASFVNFARGAQVVDADLIAALDAGHLQRAVLDVFALEPLPPDHPFWRHPKVTVLPHVSALTDARSAALVVAANLRALARGEAVPHLVDRLRGY
jgi:glyoxylate/hydroxypyruvate reductase A